LPAPAGGTGDHGHHGNQGNRGDALIEGELDQGRPAASGKRGYHLASGRRHAGYQGALRDQAQLFFEHPFRERLAEHRPLVLDAELAADLAAIGFGRLGRAVKLPTLMWTIPVVTWRRS
jgi:hypothetical protein